MEKAYASVYITDIAYSIDRAYTYFVPTELRAEIKVGSVVVVPFGNANKRVSAVVTAFSESCEYPRVKPIDSAMNYPFDVPEDIIRTCAFMKDRCFCTFGTAFRTVTPPGINLGTETFYSVCENADLTSLNSPAEFLVRKILTEKKSDERKLVREFGDEVRKLLASLVKSGILIKNTAVPEKVNEKNITTVSLTVDGLAAKELLESEKELTPKQKELVELLLDYPCSTLGELEELGNISASVVSALVKKGYAEKTERTEMRRAYEFDDIPEKPDVILNEEQAAACGGLTELALSRAPGAAMLFGVTGSGKTNVIIETARRVIADGRRVIVLMPEIGLTSQAVKLYAGVFGKRLAVMHSMLSVGERTDTYRRIRSGEIDIVIGTRSAVFAPLDDLGMIVIDEEQASTYKSELSPKYHAHDIARFRCSESGALMLLASATPSVESFYKAKKGVYRLFTLKNRYGGARLPQVIIEDLRDDATVIRDKTIGQKLEAELKKVKEKGLQSILFVGRRGYNSHISCRDCGNVFTCPHCSVSLTYHAYSGIGHSDKKLTCHYCGFTRPLPEVCDCCGGKHIGFSGYGTQKIQDELHALLPDCVITRMDSDTTVGKFSHDRIIEEFSQGKSDILFGTQMISKGFDFPRVALSAAVSVDNSLYMNDFRAGERTFSLITQLIGRAGRGEDEGIALLQTYNPENEILKLAASQDYEKFFESEIALRKATVFPPFCSMAVFGFSSENETECASSARKFDSMLLSLYDESYKDLTIIRFGPFPCGIYRVSGKYRQRIILKYKDSAKAREFLASLLSKAMTALPKSVKTDLDINPTVV